MQLTAQQRKALHKYCELVARELNEAGYSVQLVLAQSADVIWTKDNVKNLLWRPLQRAALGKESTTELDKHDDISIVYDILNRFLGEHFHLHIPFPSHEMGFWETAPLKDTNHT